MKEYFEWHIASNPAHVPPLVQDILRMLGGELGELTQEEHNDIRLILSELILNAVLHGNLSDEGKRVRVRVRVAAADKTIDVRIADEGRGFNVEEVMKKYTGEEFPENGRGIALARALADEFGYGDGGRTVTFLKRVGVSPLAEVLYGPR